jgi:hypothetical protein
MGEYESKLGRKIKPIRLMKFNEQRSKEDGLPSRFAAPSRFGLLKLLERLLAAFD